MDLLATKMLKCLSLNASQVLLSSAPSGLELATVVDEAHVLRLDVASDGEFLDIESYKPLEPRQGEPRLPNKGS